MLLKVVISLWLLPVRGFGPKQNKNDNFEQLYTKGKEAYLENDFSACVALMENALQDYKSYQALITRCKRDCHKQIKSQSSVIEHIQEMVPFEKLIQETLCLMKCKEGKIPQNRDEFASQSTRADFEAKKPYDYLQLCYYKTNDLQKAAEAAYTNHIYNRENLVMVENLNYYLSLPEVEEAKVVDMEEEDYVASYLTATDQYRAEDWQGMVATMETALQQFLAAEESCRLSCDKPFDMGW